MLLTLYIIAFVCFAYGKRVGIWIYLLVVDWIEAGLNVNLMSIVRKGRSLSCLRGLHMGKKMENECVLPFIYKITA